MIKILEDYSVLNRVTMAMSNLRRLVKKVPGVERYPQRILYGTLNLANLVMRQQSREQDRRVNAMRHLYNPSNRVILEILAPPVR